MRKTLSQFALGLFALPLIGIAGMLVLRAVLEMGRVSASLAVVPAEPSSPKHPDPNLVHMRPGDTKEYSWLTVIKPDELFPRRRVRVFAYMDYSEIVEAQIRSASPADQKIYANLFAPDVARRECERIKQAFAARCEVDHASAEARLPGRFSVNMTLLFTNKEPFGAFSAADALTYQESKAPLSLNGGANSIVTLGQQEAERLELYRLAVRTCASFRRNIGHCAIGDIDITSNPTGRSLDVFRLEGTATMLTLHGTQP